MTTSEALPLEADPLPGTDAGEERLTRKDRAALRPAWRQPLALIGITIILAWIIIAIFAPELAPYPPNLQFAPLNVAPNHIYLFGTDELGRDVFSRVLYGARLSLPLAVLLVAVAMMIGSALGAIAGFFSGVVDSVIMRIADVVFAFPGIILALAVAAALGAQLRNAVLAVIVVSWPSYSRLSRGLVLGARNSEYVTSARLLGSSGWRTMWVELRPNIAGPIIVLAALDIGNAVLLLSGLSFLGLGAQPPTAEWGSMVSEGVQNFNSWWIGLFPGLAILTVVLAFNFVGDALRDMLDPPDRTDDPEMSQQTSGQVARHVAGAADAEMTGQVRQSLLEVENLTVALRTSRGIRRAVDGISFSIGQGEILGIAGESGSGKTLTALSLLGLLPIGARTSGSVRFDGKELLGLKRRDLREVRGKLVALVSQDPATALHPLLRIDVQMTEHVRAHLGFSKEQARDRAIEMLTAVRIPDPEAALYSHPHQFSGGMRQRIAIAMALACEPRLLIADEPTTALDVTVQAGILRLLDQLRRERGVSVMIITHDLGVLSSIADQICVLYGGRVGEYGPTDLVLGSPRHPYTKGLMQSLPGASAAGEAMVPIQGAPPSLDAMPRGCAFHPRCEWAKETCRTVVPTLRTLEDGRRLGCDIDPFAALEPTGNPSTGNRTTGNPTTGNPLPVSTTTVGQP